MRKFRIEEVSPHYNITEGENVISEDELCERIGQMFDEDISARNVDAVLESHEFIVILLGKQRWHEHSRVKCDCSHYPKDHHAREGWCGCTWYYPNHRYILRKKDERKNELV